MQVVVMGVTGVGKSTVGERIADLIGANFVDADDFHPPENVEKMRAGIPLDDHDRAPWLAAINAFLLDAESQKRTIVLACSALKREYREQLRDGIADFRLIHLRGSRTLIADRLSERKGHYMNPALLDSQLATLETPDDAIDMDIDDTPEGIAERAVAALGKRAAGGTP